MNERVRGEKDFVKSDQIERSDSSLQVKHFSNKIDLSHTFYVMNIIYYTALKDQMCILNTG